MNPSSFRLILLALTVAVSSPAADAAANPPPKRAPVKLTDAPTRQQTRVYHVTPEGELKLHFFLPQTGKATDKRPATDQLLPNLVNAAGDPIGEKIARALFQKKGAPPAIFLSVFDRGI